MQYSVETPGGLTRRLKIQVPADRLESAVEKRLRQLGKRAKIAGFRPGKAPMKVLMGRYGDQARYEALDEIVKATYPEALQQADLKPASRPSIEIGKSDAGADLEYTAEFDVYPEITIKDLNKVKIEKPVVEIAEEDIQHMIESMQKQQRSFESVERASQDGDEVTFDFAGTLNGEPFEGGKAENTTAILGEGRFLADFENGIRGHKAGDEFTIQVDFPDDYPAEELKGKQAEFAITLKNVAAPSLPEVDEAFIKAAGIEEGTEEALRSKITKSLERERDRAMQQKLKAAAFEGLLEQNKIEVPAGLVGEEISRMRHEALQRLPEQARQGAQGNEAQAKQLFPDEVFRSGAERRVMLGLLIAQLIEDKSIELDAARVDARIEDMAADYEQPEEVRKFYRSNPQIMQNLEAEVMEAQVLDALLAEAKVSEKKLKLEELMSAEQGQ